MSDEEWSDWIEHDGQPVPELMGLKARVVAANGRDEVGIIMNSIAPPPGQYSAFVWASLPKRVQGNRILRYRIRKPRALQQLIDLVENLPAPQPEEVAA
ncbi:MAG: hypothetical protein DI533_04615 [Cereibacter sphaeroides]|uniref:Uncharacterized protein n=1 Tax=Cereibacter sphaeroides TaxID=1063 RepID=A0A2W5SCU9_CERSP|nr:MAG: hypothetical protein DI533_04615 [Cereibacter sphaeroides]